MLGRRRPAVQARGPVPLSGSPFLCLHPRLNRSGQEHRAGTLPGSLSWRTLTAPLNQLPYNLSILSTSLRVFSCTLPLLSPRRPRITVRSLGFILCEISWLAFRDPALARAFSGITHVLSFTFNPSRGPHCAVAPRAADRGNQAGPLRLCPF